MTDRENIKKTSACLLPDNWLSWLTESRLLGHSDHAATEHLVNQGFSREVIESSFLSLDSDPIYKAADIIGQRFRKLESSMNIKHQVEKVSDNALVIERRSDISADEFREAYYSKNRPVIITDIVKNWPAFGAWSPQLFSDKFGDEQIEVMMGRDADPEYEPNFRDHKSTCTVREYVDKVLSSDRSNDFYLVANNEFFASPKTRDLLNDVTPLPPFLNPASLSQVFLWFGPAGTVTPLHHDEMNVFFAQVQGRKQVTMISPDQTPWLYNDFSVYSRVNMEHPDLDEFPLYAKTEKIEFILEPGDALFIPVGWWHHVRALDVCISLSFLNFVYPNNYRWKNPSIKRLSIQ